MHPHTMLAWRAASPPFRQIRVSREMPAVLSPLQALPPTPLAPSERVCQQKGVSLVAVCQDVAPTATLAGAFSSQMEDSVEGLEAPSANAVIL